MPTPRFAKRRSSRLGRLPALVLLALIASLWPAAVAWAEPITVTTKTDPAPGSLRDAIEKANLSQGPDTITFDPNVIGTIELGQSLPPINSDLDIVGPGQSVLTVRRAATAPEFSVFFIMDFTVSISGLTITGGKADSGGGIDSFGSLTLTRVTVSGNEAAAGGSEGGGILAFNHPLTLRESIVTGNVVNAKGANGAAAVGGGIAMEAGGLILRSTISNNTAEASAPTGQVRAQGGGIFLQDGSERRIEQSTISANSVTAGGGSSQSTAEGGGAFTENGAISGSTVTGNTAVAGTANGSNLFDPAEVTVRDSIISNGQGAPNCREEVSSGGFNIEDGTSCGFTKAGDRSGVDPGLAPTLADNGGPTPTIALLPGSIAIDQGNAFGAATDQRGLPRPTDLPGIASATGGDGSDIGALEAQPPPPRDTRPPNTRIVHGPARRSANRLARFRFTSTEARSRFKCKLDKGPFKRCASPFKRKVKPGKHVFRVRAIDAAGNVDRTPARYVWRVKAPRRHTPR